MYMTLSAIAVHWIGIASVVPLFKMIAFYIVPHYIPKVISAVV